MSPVFIPGETVRVPEIPYQPDVTLAPPATAVVVVDMQNDFVKPGGALVVADALDTLPRIRRLLESARRAGVRVAYTQDTHIEGDPEWDTFAPHCVPGSWGWQFVEELAPAEGDLVCPKDRYDGFYGTWLDHFLSHVWRVENVVVVGTVSNICVLHTAASAGLRWFRIVVPADGISALNEFDQAMALRQISWLYHGGVVRSVSDIRFTGA